MRRLLLLVALALAGGAACSDDTLVSPSPVPGVRPVPANAFRNRAVLVPSRPCAPLRSVPDGLSPSLPGGPSPTTPPEIREQC